MNKMGVYLAAAILTSNLAWSSGTWKVGGTSQGSAVGSISGLQYVSDTDGDRVYVKFSNLTEYYVCRLSDFGNDSSKFNRIYSTLLSVEASGEPVTDIFLAAAGSTTFTGINLGIRF